MKKCDKCKTEFRENNKIFLVQGGEITSSFELCESCLIGIETELAGGPMPQDG